MAGHAAQDVRVLVVHLAVQGIPARRRQLGGGDPPAELVRRPVAGVVHAERGEDLPLEVGVERLAGCFLEHEREDVHAEVAVLVAAARLAAQRRLQQRRAGVGGGEGDAPEIATRGQAAAVRQQVPHGHEVLLAAVGEGRQVAHHGGVEVEPPFVEQRHRGGGRADDLGHRREVVDRPVRRDGRAVTGPREAAVAALEDGVTAPPHDHRRPGISTGPDAALHHALDRLEPPRGHADLGRPGGRQAVVERQGEGEGSKHAGDRTGGFLEYRLPGCFGSRAGAVRNVPDRGEPVKDAPGPLRATLCAPEVTYCTR